MFSDLTDKFLERQIKENRIEADDRELYQFGYKLLVLELINFSILIVIGLLFHCLPYMALFAVVYIPLRSYAGGYHASTPYGCAVVSAILELLLAASIRFSVYDILLPWMYLLVVGSQLLIWFLSPVEALHKPLTEGQKQKYRRVTRGILLVEVMALALCIQKRMLPAGFVIGGSHLILALLMVLPQKE